MRLLAVALLFAALGVGPVRAGEALIDAVRAGDREAAIALIEDGADVDARTSDGTTALLWAAHNGDAELVERIIKAGADVSAQNDYGANPMSEAAMTADIPVMTQLLEAGADPDSPNPEGETALMLAARGGNIEAAKLLLKHGADINAREDWGGQSALMWATAQGQAEMVALLISKGADVNARGVARIWQRKVTAEPRPKDMNKGGFTPLMYAAREGCLACARHLVEAGADIDAHDPDRVTALNLALINFHFDAAAYLVDAGADVNKWDIFGRTPLYNAVDFNTLPIGGRPDIPSADDKTGLDIAKMLLARGAYPNPQLKARPPYRNAVFDRRADHVLSTGATPLLRAARGSDNDAVALLLAHGAVVDLPNQMGVTPLMAAAGLGFTDGATRGRLRTQDDAVETVKILLEAGGDINRRVQWMRGQWGRYPDEIAFFRDVPLDGRTALHGAAKLGWTKMVRFLVENGAEMQVADINGKTALDLAMGRYEPAFLQTPPEPLVETAETLRALCREKPDCELPERDKVLETAQTL